MRHILLVHPPASGPRGVSAPSLMAVLVALSGGSQGMAPGPLGAVAGAIDLAAVAKATDQRLGPTPRAQKQPGRQIVTIIAIVTAIVTAGALRVGADQTWTDARIGGILALHLCPAQCGARRRA